MPKIKELANRYRDYFRDFGLNIIASAILTITTSLIVNPVMAAKYSEDKYGTILTLNGVVAVLSSTFGNTLNNVKLINKNNENQKENYNFLITLVSILSFIVMLVLSLTFYKVDPSISFMGGIHALIATLNSYYSVTYRLKIDYKQNLKYSVFVSTAYIIGLIVSSFWDMWVCIYICADIGGFIYLYKSSTLFKDSYLITAEMRGILKKYITLILASFFAQIMMYLDRFIIYPLVGGNAVATYSVASFFGKSISLVMGPIAMVLLSYYADAKRQITKKIFWQINFIIGVFSIAFILVSIVFAPFFTKLIYPTLYDSARPYLLIANVASIVNIMGTMTNPFILRFCDMRWQMYINIFYGVIYITFGFILITLWGLWGFAVASTAANLIRLIMMYFVGNKYLKN